jgi:general secretion pathway protein J
MRDRNRQFGFTLIELLLSLSILSIIMVIIIGALRISVRAWEKGENVLAVQQRSRTVLDQLTRQLTSASVLMSAQKEQPLVTFAGNSRSIEFSSSLPLITKIQFGPVHVKYVIETGSGGKKRLLLFEENITVEDYFSERQLKLDTEALVLIGELEDLRFEYLSDGSDGPDLNWTSAWQSQNVTDLPRAVRITYREEKNSHNVRVIARMYQWDRWFKGSEVQGSGFKVQGSPVKFASLHIFDIFNGASRVPAFAFQATAGRRDSAPPGADSAAGLTE